MSEVNQSKKITIKRKFVADGVFQAELNQFLTRILGQFGYSGLEVRVSHMGTEIRIRVAKAEEILKGQKQIKEIQSLIEKRFNYSDEGNKLDLRIVPVPVSALCSAWQAENIKYKLLGGSPVRTVVQQVLNMVKRTGQAKGCQVIVAGKVRGQRAKAQKYTWGYLISTGKPKEEFVDEARRHVHMRQGVLGVRVRIFLSERPNARGGIKVLPDSWTVHEPKADQFKDIKAGAMKSHSE